MDHLLKLWEFREFPLSFLKADSFLVIYFTSLSILPQWRMRTQNSFIIFHLKINFTGKAVHLRVSRTFELEGMSDSFVLKTLDVNTALRKINHTAIFYIVT